jgi:hypothetical protein
MQGCEIAKARRRISAKVIDSLLIGTGLPGWMAVMAGLSRYGVAKLLEPFGLRNTLVVMQERDGCTVNRLKSLGQLPELTCLGRLSSSEVAHIGRIGPPDASLPISWANSLSFYGQWFDRRASDEIRQRLCALPRETIMKQAGRDDQYAMVGSYYSCFLTIMDVKQRVPLVLIDDRYLAALSFPVVFPNASDAKLERELMFTLRTMLRRYRGAAPLSGGIIVDEE